MPNKLQFNPTVDDINSWSILFDYFIYKLNINEDGSGWIYLVELTKNFAVTKVKDVQASDPTCKEFMINTYL